jgi:serine/threonine-protein kinase
MNPSHEESTVVRPILSLGRYAVFGELATGGMATVHFGRMSSLGGFNRTVAIKRMRRDIARDPEFVAMFLDEARLTSRIEHPNVVATLDVVAESGEVFLVMEYVRGESLQRLRRAAHSRREKIPVGIAVSVIGGVLSGLDAAHDALGEDGVPLGIIHRDVSPQNILVGEDGIARITDFGIAKAESRLQVTHDGQMKGKLPYMAPEQLGGSGKRLDRRVDIFSSAVVMWELLAGKGLFRADHPGETIAKVLSAPIPSLCSLRPDVPQGLDRAIRKGLSRDPSQRPSTAEAFALEIEEGLGQGPASPRVVGAWVAGLAGDVLANRLKYVREMESTSWSMRLPDGTSRASAAEILSNVAQPSEILLDPEPDLASEPSGPRPRPSPPALPQPLAAPATPLPVPKPSPPPARLPPPTIGPQSSATKPTPATSSPGPVEAAFPQAPPSSVVSPVPVALPPSAEISASPTQQPEPLIPLEVSAEEVLAVPMSASIPPFAKRNRMPLFIVGGVVGFVLLLLVIAVVSSSSLFDAGVPPAETSTVLPNPEKPRRTTTEPTMAATDTAVPAASVPSPETTASTSPEPSASSEADAKEGSSGANKTRPVYTAPPATGKGTTRPYLPDMP